MTQALPLMRNAFRTSVTDGELRLYELRFRFPDIRTMQAADAEWRAFAAAPQDCRWPKCSCAPAERCPALPVNGWRKDEMAPGSSALAWPADTSTDGVTTCAGSCCDCGKGCAAPGVPGALPPEPVAEMIASEITGISVREIEGRWKFLRPGDKLYAEPPKPRTRGVRAAPLSADAVEQLRLDTLRHGHCPACRGLYPMHHTGCTHGVATGEGGGNG